VADPEEVGHNEYDHMGRTLELGDTRVDETALAELCRQYRVRDLSVFGSAARGETRPDSDIDLLVEFLPDAEVDLIDHAGSGRPSPIFGTAPQVSLSSAVSS
jgi:hypothetical protein